MEKGPEGPEKSPLQAQGSQPEMEGCPTGSQGGPGREGSKRLRNPPTQGILFLDSAVKYPKVKMKVSKSLPPTPSMSVTAQVNSQPADETESGRERTPCVVRPQKDQK